MHSVRLASSIWACCAGVRLGGGGVDDDDAEVVAGVVKDGESRGLAAEDGEGIPIDSIGETLVSVGDGLADRSEPCCFETCVVGDTERLAGAGVAFRTDAEEAFDVLADFGFGPGEWAGGDAVETRCLGGSVSVVAVRLDVAVERVVDRFAEEERGKVRVLEAIRSANHGSSPSHR